MGVQGYNRVFLLGTVDADPELKYTTGGTAKLSLRIATTERYKTKEGQWTDKTSWHTVAIWGKRAEGLYKVVDRNGTVFIEGSLRTDRYEKDGSTRYFTYVNANHVSLCGNKGPWSAQEAGAGQMQQKKDINKEQQSPHEIEADDFDSDDVPF